MHIVIHASAIFQAQGWKESLKEKRAKFATKFEPIVYGLHYGTPEKDAPIDPLYMSVLFYDYQDEAEKGLDG